MHGSFNNTNKTHFFVMYESLTTSKEGKVFEHVPLQTAEMMDDAITSEANTDLNVQQD